MAVGGRKCNSHTVNMQLKVHKSDGTTDTFGNVMAVKADAESYFLEVGYDISNEKHNGVFSKTYQTGAWKTCEIDTQITDYGTPTDPL